MESLLGRSLTTRIVEELDGPYGYDSRLVGYSLGPVDHARLDEARQLMAFAIEPASPEMIIRELTRLRMLTKSRASESLDREMAYHAFVEELREFPADVVRWALRKLARTEKFFPALAEMITTCEEAFEERRMLVNAIGLQKEIQ